MANSAFRLIIDHPTPSVFHADRRGMPAFWIRTLGPELQSHPHSHASAFLFTKGERKCHDQMATKSPRRPDGDLNGSWEPNGDQNKPFWTPLGHHGHLGRHLVAIRSSRQFGHGTCVHLKYPKQHLILPKARFLAFQGLIKSFVLSLF